MDIARFCQSCGMPRVSVVAEDGKIILSGNVHSWAERQEAERAAWSAPGVKLVEDRLTVVP
jgi:osmotically-inducible protein OsmY